MELIHPHDPQDIAFIDGENNSSLSYEELHMRMERLAPFFDGAKRLVFLFIRPTIECLIAYLTLLRKNQAVALFDHSLNSQLKQNLIDQYHPEFIIEEYGGGYPNYQSIAQPWTSSLQIFQKIAGNLVKTHPDLQVLLSTSGTTGSPKLVRLSQKNILSNATAIVNYLNILPTDRAITSLSFSYSYGLSVLHSYLMAGACVVLTSQSIMQRGFWDIANTHNCTSMAGVPSTYQLLDKLDFENLLPASFKVLTQAGGRLDRHLVIKFHEIMVRHQGKFYPMYGQTEATARIAYVPPDLLPLKAGAIGIPIPGGKLEVFIDEQKTSEAYKEGELVYIGDNVMMGYATHSSDLALGDQLHGRLNTGDIGYQDADGIYFLTGRLKRISKVYGQRINLDEIEGALSKYGRVAAVSDDVTIRLYFESSTVNFEACSMELAHLFHLSPTTFECVLLPHLPLTLSGKIDYTQLKVGYARG